VENRKIIFSQKQCPGDVLMSTRCIGDLKETYPDWQIDIRTTCPEIFENSPRLTNLDDNDSTVEKIDLTYQDINNCGWKGQHFSDAFRFDLEQKLGLPINKTGLKPEIWISNEEKGWINQVEVEFGYKGKFWLLNAGHKDDAPLKFYPYYQEVADFIHKNTAIRLVQVGHKDHYHPEINGALNLVGKTDLRQLIRLTYWADGVITPLSFLMVLAGALESPCVVVANAAEPIRWQVFPNHRFLTYVGSMSCARWDGCWKSKREDCKQLIDGFPKCLRMINPEYVYNAVMSYYEGGVLNWGVR
jgi:ADP-heptose:LPS heptosyltransferase